MSFLSGCSPSRERRCGSTTFQPARHWRTISGMSAGGSCRSQSMITTARPLAWWMPPMVAAGWPKRLEKASSLTRGSAACASAISAKVRSRQGSAQKMIS